MKKILFAMPVLSVLLLGCHKAEIPNANDYIDEYGINHGPGVEIDGVVWAPVNCGYHKDDFKYGKLYQWGRKYGQGYVGDIYDVNGIKSGEYSDAVKPILHPGPVSVSEGQSGSNSDKYYKVGYNADQNIVYTDWCTNPNDQLWNSGSESYPIKTEYDPCPAGWRVPTAAELYGLINYSSLTADANGQSGYWLSGTSSNSPQVFFPAAGDIFVDGDGEGRGFEGIYWSSGTNCSLDGYAQLMCISETSGILYGESMRAAGYSVRCVKE